MIEIIFGTFLILNIFSAKIHKKIELVSLEIPTNNFSYI